MFRLAKRKETILAAVLAVALGLGLTTPAPAEGEATYSPDDAMLTKVIDAPTATDASGDAYVFHFAGGGVAEDGAGDGEDPDKLYSDGVKQDMATLKAGDRVPVIGDNGDVRLGGITLTSDNTLSNGQVAQTVVQKSLSEILDSVDWPHAGVYTYVVTEKSATPDMAKLADGTYINKSQAEYTLRVRVRNAKTEDQSVLNNKELEVDSVTVDKKKDDNGNDKTGKVDPTYPKATAGKITQTADGEAPESNKLAGDNRGRDVAGFTFANEYIQGGAFVVEKLYDGKMSDRTKYSTVELVVYSEAATNPDAHGAVLTYEIVGDGIDLTDDNQDSDGERLKLNGVYQDIPQVNHYMARFKDNGWCKIRADLKEGSAIRITGEFGPYNVEYAAQAPNGQDRRMTLSTNGLLNGQVFYVIESDPGDYEPTGYIYTGSDDGADPRKDASNMTAEQKLPDSMPDETDVPGPEYENNPDLYVKRTLEKGSLFVKGDATGSATTVFVVNKIKEDKVTPTGILIDNLPYILMIGIPVAIFAAMFVLKRRGHAVA